MSQNLWGWGTVLLFCCGLVTQSCPTLCDPMVDSPPGSSVHGILQARILEWVAISFSRGVFPTQGLNPLPPASPVLQLRVFPLSPREASPSSLHYSNVYHRRLVFPDSDLHINGITQYTRTLLCLAFYAQHCICDVHSCC